MPLPRPAPGTGKWWVIGIVGCLAGAAVAVWFGLAATWGQVSWVDTGYRVVDDRTVEVRFDVHRPPGQRVTCTVRALNRGFGTVGTIEVTVPANDQRAVGMVVMLRTTTRAVTGQVKTCATVP
ncbi:MAG TPA: DUF4307 domain-containing protein [Dermatophilaceae bacterium]|nr:DUF4307 domain-containing protein [Dermatophilaceae bacterium]